MDPAEVRRRNLIAKDAFPHTDGVGRRPTTPATTRARSTSPSARRATTSCGPSRRAAARTATRCSSASASAPTSRSRTGSARPSSARSRSRRTASAIVRTGSFSHGQGHETTFAMIVAERLGLPIEKVTVVKGDTDVVADGHRHVRLEVDADRRDAPRGSPRRTSSSRREELVADYLEASADDIVLDGAAAASTSPARPSRRSRGPSSPARAADEGRLDELKADPRATRPRRPSRSARTSRWSRSTPRRARSSCSGSSRVDDAGTLINPLARGGPGPRWRRDGRRAGALRGGRLRRGRQPAHRDVRQLRVSRRRRAPALGGGRDGDADSGQPAGRQGDRRVGDDRLDPGRAQRRDRRPLAARRPPRRRARNGENVWRAIQEAQA